jgi:hypothetical protein
LGAYGGLLNGEPPNGDRQHITQNHNDGDLGTPCWRVGDYCKEQRKCQQSRSPEINNGT